MWRIGTRPRVKALTLSMAGLVELARPCSISGAVKVDTSFDRPQFLNAKVPVADSSKEVGLMILHILLWPGKKKGEVKPYPCCCWFLQRKTLDITIQQQQSPTWCNVSPVWNFVVLIVIYPCKRHPLKTLQCPAAGTRPPPPAEVPLSPPVLQLMWQMCCSSCTHSKNAPADAHAGQYGVLLEDSVYFTGCRTSARFPPSSTCLHQPDVSLWGYYCCCHSLPAFLRSQRQLWGTVRRQRSVHWTLTRLS